jgi:hypothetical protein
VGLAFLIPNCCKGNPTVAGTFTGTVNNVSKTVQFQLKEVNPNVVPEPASICLLGTGFVAIGLKRFHRKRQRPAPMQTS